MRSKALAAIAAIAADKSTFLSLPRNHLRDVHLHSSKPGLSLSLGISRGGASTIVDRLPSPEITITPSVTSTSKPSHGSGLVHRLQRGGDDSSAASALQITPKGRAILSMAICMSLHYLGYSLARPATMTLFTSSKLGFGGSVSAYPFAMTFISPVSFVLLMLYGRFLDRHGPHGALRRSTLFCASILGGSAAGIAQLASRISQDGTGSAAMATRLLVGALFIFRESYVQLITSQHWSFMSSVLTPAQSSTWFAPISGLTSVTSAFAAMFVGTLTKRVGLTGVMGVAAIALAASLWFADKAYSIAEKNGFNPADEHYKKQAEKKKGSDGKQHNGGDDSLITKARDVFARVPTLWALFCEILACQGLSTLLNVCCVNKVSEVIPDDNERADWMGKFFATINVISSFLQFGILPAVMPNIDPSVLWKLMPMIMVTLTSLFAMQKDPSLDIIASSFLVMKTMEFSVRRMLDEMIYVPLDFESRFVGKEVIGVLGYRFGKSAASLALSAFTAFVGTSGLRELSFFTSGSAFAWLATSWRLSTLVPTRAQADADYAKMKSGKSS